MASKRRRLNETLIVRLREDDRSRLEIIRETHGVSLAGAVRASIRALAEQLGIIIHRDTPKI
jgi:hypothetical protein